MIRALAVIKPVSSLTSLVKGELVQSKEVFPILPYSLRSFQQSRTIKSTSKYETTALLTSRKGSEFALMSVVSLRSELKKRGLKVSGRKTQLVERLVGYDIGMTSDHDRKMISSIAIKNLKKQDHIQIFNNNNKNISKNIQISSKILTKTISTTPIIKAKGDDSTIDFYKIPTRVYTETPSEPQIKIPSLDIKSSNDKVSNNLFIKEDKKIIQVSGDNDIVTSINDTVDAVLESPKLTTTESESESESKSNPNSKETPPHEPEEEFSSKDRIFLSSFSVTVLAWWLLVPGRKPKEI